MFQEYWPRWLKLDTEKLKPIAVVDPAYVDIVYWSEQSRRGLSTMITREKENTEPTVTSAYAYDPSDPVNRGVEANEIAGYTYAYLRRIVYLDPISRERYTFITTDRSLRPGVIALLYFLRRKIEKPYDVFKTKLYVQKACANGQTAALIQALFIALAHNLLTILLRTLEKPVLLIIKSSPNKSNILKNILLNNGSPPTKWFVTPSTSPVNLFG